MKRAEKDRAMAEHIATMAAVMRPGVVAGIAGNTFAHAEKLIALVHEVAGELGLDVSHVTFKPIGADAFAENSKEHLQ